MMGDTEGAVAKQHLSRPPEFEFEAGQCFRAAGVQDPEEYWFVKARVWNYDADAEDAIVQIRAYQQYVIGEVSTLGGGERLVTEEDLSENYEPVSLDVAEEVL